MSYGNKRYTLTVSPDPHLVKTPLGRVAGSRALTRCTLGTMGLSRWSLLKSCLKTPCVLPSGKKPHVSQRVTWKGLPMRSKVYVLIPWWINQSLWWSMDYLLFLFLTMLSTLINKVPLTELFQNIMILFWTCCHKHSLSRQCPNL